MMKPRNLGALVALGALTALPACSMFGGGSSGSQYSSATPPPSYAAQANENTATNAATANQTVAPVSRGMIRKVQTALKQNNDYSGAIDGIWGPMTESGVRNWQQAHSLNASGEIDEATLQSMNIRQGAQTSDMSSGASQEGVNNTQAAGNGGMNNAQTTPAGGGQNYSTAGNHQTGSSYTSNNNGQPATAPESANQGAASNGAAGNSNSNTNSTNATH